MIDNADIRFFVIEDHQDSALTSVPIFQDTTYRRLSAARYRIKAVIEGYDIGIITKIEWPIFNVDQSVNIYAGSVVTLFNGKDECNVRAEKVSPGVYKVTHIIDGLPIDQTATMKVSSPPIDYMKFIENDDTSFEFHHELMDLKVIVHADHNNDKISIICSDPSLDRTVQSNTGYNQNIINLCFNQDIIMMCGQPSNNANSGGFKLVHFGGGSYGVQNPISTSSGIMVPTGKDQYVQNSRSNLYNIVSQGAYAQSYIYDVITNNYLVKNLKVFMPGFSKDSRVMYEDGALRYVWTHSWVYEFPGEVI